MNEKVTVVLSLPAQGLICSDVLMNFHDLMVFLNLLRCDHDILSNQQFEYQPRQVFLKCRIVGIVITNE